MLQKIVRSLLLSGACSLPLATMAAETALFPRLHRTPIPLILAQATGGDGEGYSGSDHDDPTPDPHVDAVDITPETTDEIVSALDDAVKFCNNVYDPRFKVDCLADQYDAAAKLIPQGSGYEDARQELLIAANSLHALAVANAAPDKAPATVKSGGHRSHRALTPVADPDAAAKKALVIIQHAKKALLRSGHGSHQRSAAYTEVAAAVESTKVLLRST